jgi:rfaE bifunctional protein nucleotidyltransferase chain/domain
MNIKKKILNKDKLVKLLKEQKSKNKKIVLCHGVFDLVHLGHINHFKKAKELGDILIVSVTKDNFIKKGYGRPYFNHYQRIKYLENLEIIDYVYLCNSNSASESIKLIKPDFYVKGSEYNNKIDDTGRIYYEKSLVKKYKGEIFYTNEEIFSSSNILNKNFPIFNKEQREFINNLKKSLSFADITNILDKLKKLKILIIGECIIDRYNFGTAVGKSAKYPYLTFQSKYRDDYLGGSLAIARNLSSYVKNISVICSFNKKDINYFSNKIESKNVKLINFNIKNNFDTLVKERFVDKASGYKIFGNYSSSKIQNDFFYEKLENYLSIRCSKFDLVIVSDYSHGLLNINTSKTICKKAKFLGINCQLNSSNLGYHTVNNYKNYDLLVLNESELRQEFRDNSSKIEVLASKLLKKNNIENIIVTKGSEGVILVTKKNEKFKCPAFANKVIDKVGAGDAILSLASVLKKIGSADENLILFLSSIMSAKIIENYGNKETIKLEEMKRFLEYTLK